MYVVVVLTSRFYYFFNAVCGKICKILPSRTKECRAQEFSQFLVQPMQGAMFYNNGKLGTSQ